MFGFESNVRTLRYQGLKARRFFKMGWSLHRRPRLLLGSGSGEHRFFHRRRLHWMQLLLVSRRRRLGQLDWGSLQRVDLLQGALLLTAQHGRLPG